MIYPRVCGVTSGWRADQAVQVALSPRVRGNLGRMRFAPPKNGTLTLCRFDRCCLRYGTYAVYLEGLPRVPIISVANVPLPHMITLYRTSLLEM